MKATARRYLKRPRPSRAAEPWVWSLPAGMELSDGLILTYPAHRACGCVDCVRAFAAFDAAREALPGVA